MAIESESTKTLEETKKMTHHIEQENSNDQEYSINNVMLEMLNKIITEVLVEEKFEVWDINQKCEEITTKLSLQYNDQLENYNRMLGKQVMSHNEINDERYRYIGELN